MTSQRWTRIRSPVSPFPHRLHLTFSLGPQQTERQVAVPAQQKVLPLIPLPPSTLLTHTHTQCSLIHASYIPPIKPSVYPFIPRMFCLFELSLIRKYRLPFFASSCADTPLFPPLISDHSWQPSAFLSLLRMTALRQVKEDIYTLSAGPQMKWPFPSLFHRSYKLSPPTAGTTTPLAL